MPITGKSTSPTMNAIARYLRLRRERVSWSQARAAIECDMTVTAVAMIERCQREPRITTLVKLLDAYGTSLELMSQELGL